MIPSHAPRIEIDLDAIRGNLSLLRKRLKPGVLIMVPVKADAYGHGSVAIARFALENGADRLGVARPAEAVRLRSNGITGPIHVLEPAHPDDAVIYFDHDIIPTLANLDAAKVLSGEGVRRGRPLLAHLKCDTGMSRIGFDWQSGIAEIQEVAGLPGLSIEGIFTHFSRADEDMPHTARQLERFRSVLGRLEASGLRPALAHAANSAGTLLHPDAHFEMVRPGLATYGYSPAPDLLQDLPLRPALKLTASIRHLQWIRPGEEVSYGGLWTARRHSLIATIPIGYGDGFSRLQKNAVVSIAGHLAPQVGRICMDLCMVDVTDIPPNGIAIGTPVQVIDAFTAPELSVDAVASRQGTISYELICALGRRLPRIYRDGACEFPEQPFSH